MTPAEHRPEIYPRLLRRVRAILIDYGIFIGLFLTWVAAFDAVAALNPAIRLAPLLLGAAVLEPGLVAWTGGTIGHHVMGLKIRDAATDTRIGFFRASLRAVTRAVLGVVSLVFVLWTRRHQAIHDYVSGTIVVLKNPDGVAGGEKLAERGLASGDHATSGRL